MTAPRLAIAVLAATGCGARSGRAVVPAAVCLHGHVLDANAAPVANTLVLVTGTDLRTEATRSNRSGAYAFACRAARWGHVEARSSSGSSMPELVMLDDAEHDVVVRATGHIAGRVRGARGPLRVVVRAVGLAAGVGVTVRADGRFSFDELPEGAYDVIVTRDGHGVVAIRTRVEAGRVREVLLDAPPPEPVSVVVHVTGADCTAVTLRARDLERTASCTGHEAAFDAVTPGHYDACIAAHCKPLDVTDDRSWFELDVPQ